MVKMLGIVKIKRRWYFQDNRLREFRQVENPHVRITFDEYRKQGLRIIKSYQPILIGGQHDQSREE